MPAKRPRVPKARVVVKSTARAGVHVQPRVHLSVTQARPVVVFTGPDGRTRVLGKKPVLSKRDIAFQQTARRRKLLREMEKMKNSPGALVKQGLAERKIPGGQIVLTAKGKEELARRKTLEAERKARAAGLSPSVKRMAAEADLHGNIGDTIHLSHALGKLEEGTQYAWKQIVGQETPITGEKSVSATFIPTKAGVYTFQVVMNRTDGWRSEKLVLVYVK